MFTFVITLLLAALAVAAPAGKTCILLNAFDLDTVTVQPLFAWDSGSGILLVTDAAFKDMQGTPITVSGDSPNANLHVELNGRNGLPHAFGTGDFYLSVSDVGEVRGGHAPVIGAKDAEWAHWSLSTVMVLPKATSASQIPLLCDVTNEITGLTYKALSYGNSNADGSMPKGCTHTIVAKMAAAC